LGTLVRDRTAVLGIVLCGGMALAGLLAPVLARYPPAELHMVDQFTPPGAQYWFGTDDLGRDVFSRVLYAARVSLLTGLFSVGLGGSIGSLLGLIGAFYGSLVDNIIMRFMDGLLAFPAVLLALAIIAVLGPSAGNVVLAISVVYLPIFARAARGAALPIKNLEFVVAARAMGASQARIVLRTILPNSMSPLLVQASIGYASAILIEAGLSFLGLGVQPPTPSWGNMLNFGRRFLTRAPWISIAAGGAIFLTVLGLSLLGDGLRDAFDPKLRPTGGGPEAGE
jgi:peptide/nickel transport system permease protein